jgi:hypothetical protein
MLSKSLNLYKALNSQKRTLIQTSFMSISKDAKPRQEKDTFGPIEVPGDKYWGAQTQRSL